MRLFVALDIPEAVCRSLGELIARIEPLCGGARWVRAEGMHITLKFIGEANEQKVDAIRARLAPIRSPGPVEMRFHGLGFFPNERRPRVVWCGMETSSNLSSLVGDIEHALESLGVAPETRPFVPHLTLARIKSNDGVERLVSEAEQLKDYNFGSSRETQFHLYQSILKGSGAEYRRLETFSFVKEGA